MKQSFIKKVDKSGRILIPSEIRKMLKIKEGQELEVSLDNDNNIIIKNCISIKKELTQEEYNEIIRIIKKLFV